MRIENLEQNVTLDSLEQLCKAFHVDIAELFPVIQSPAVYIDQRPQMISIHETKMAARKPGDKKSGGEKQDEKQLGDKQSEGKKQ